LREIEESSLLSLLPFVEDSSSGAISLIMEEGIPWSFPSLLQRTEFSLGSEDPQKGGILSGGRGFSPLRKHPFLYLHILLFPGEVFFSLEKSCALLFRFGSKVRLTPS